MSRDLIPTRLFTINCRDKYFAADASDLNDYNLGYFSHLTLISDLGNTARFVRAKIDWDNEGDIQCWHFAPTPDAVVANPKLQGWSLTLFND